MEESVLSSAAIGDSEYVLLGESTHGTAEFYAVRAQITQRLIEEKVDYDLYIYIYIHKMIYIYIYMYMWSLHLHIKTSNINIYLYVWIFQESIVKVMSLYIEI